MTHPYYPCLIHVRRHRRIGMPDTPTPLNNNERVAHCLKQSELGASRWDRRRDDEWKITLGLWAAILASGKFIAEKQWDVPPWLPGVFGLFLLASYYFWLRGLWAANDSDKKWEFHFRNEAAAILCNPKHEVKEQPTRTKPSRRFLIADWSLRFQFGVTAFLIVVATCLIAIAPSPPPSQAADPGRPTSGSTAAPGSTAPSQVRQ